jgi:hypothetical protein
MADVQAAPPADPIPDDADAIEHGDTLESLDTLVPLEVIGVPRDHPSETDQMQLFR